jgi:UDP-glucuronate 4-epimerase
LMCNAAHLSWAQSVTILRFFTVYGPRQRPTMAISKFIRMAQSGETIPVYGNGSSQRDYTYVDDVVAAVQAALEQPQKFTVFNVGGGSPIRLDALVAAVGEATGADIRTEMLEEQPGDVVLTWADSTRIEQQLGWKASVGIVEGLRRTVAALGED